MAKYSIDSNTDGSDESTGNNCELCGTEADSLEKAEVAGAMLDICSDCTPNDPSGGGNTDDEADRRREAIRAANAGDADPDSSWAEQGTNYTDDQLPYLQRNYGEQVTTARKDHDLTVEELADEVELGVNVINIIENGQATSANLGRSDIEAVAEFLEIDIISED